MAGRGERDARFGEQDGRFVADAGPELDRADVLRRRTRGPRRADVAGRRGSEDGRAERVVEPAVRALESRGGSNVDVAFGRLGPIARLRITAPSIASIAVDALEDRADRAAETVGHVDEERLDPRLGPAGFVGVPRRLEPVARRAKRACELVPGRRDGPVVIFIHARSPCPVPEPDGRGSHRPAPAAI